MAARIDLNHKVHVLTKKEELDGRHARAPQALLDCRADAFPVVPALEQGRLRLVA